MLFALSFYILKKLITENINAPYVSIKEMQASRRKMIEYVKSKGIDITSEFTYKESESLPNRPIFGLPRDHFRKYNHDTLGLIPLSWWCYRLTPKELVDTPTDVYCGGEYREKKYNKLLYGNMHGEDIVTKDNINWVQNFIHRFATYQVPCHFLNSHKRLAIEGKGNNLICRFSDNIISYSKGEKITQNGKVIKEGDNLFLPFVHKESTYVAYSKDGDCRDWDIFENDKTKAEIYKITENGNVFVRELPINKAKLHINLPANVAYLIELK